MSERLAQEIQAVLDAKVRPVLWAHDGDIKLAGIEEGSGVVRLRLLGSCATCMGAEQTINDVVVAEIRESCPWVSDVRLERGSVTSCYRKLFVFLKGSGGET